MGYFQIKSHINDNIIFEGEFETFKACIEGAVAERIKLEHADLRNINLANAMLDDAILPGVNFTGANLSGANLSESVLTGTVFENTALYNTCLAYADLQHCHFESASFGATDITGSDLSFSGFMNLSCFTLDFSHARKMTGCVFKTPGGYESVLSRPPVVIRGLGCNPVVLTDRHIRNGHDVLHYQELLQLLKVNFPAKDRLR